MSLYEIAILDPVLQTAQIRDQSLVLWRRGEDQDLLFHRSYCIHFKSCQPSYSPCYLKMSLYPSTASPCIPFVEDQQQQLCFVPIPCHHKLELMQLQCPQTHAEEPEVRTWYHYGRMATVKAKPICPQCFIQCLPIKPLKAWLKIN